MSCLPLGFSSCPEHIAPVPAAIGLAVVFTLLEECVFGERQIFKLITSRTQIVR